MSYVKKIIYILLSFILVCSLTACSNHNTTNTKNTAASKASNVSNSDGTQTDLPSDSNALVVFYSATGSTKAIAETIAGILDADIFEITPEDPYTSEDLNWNNDNSRVSIEHNDESKRKVPLIKATPDDWEKYDTIYIGYPIWWGIAAWPVNGFIEGNNFTDKTVIPFCTSVSSELDNSSELLENTTGTGNWLEGKRFSSNASAEEIREWLNKLKLNP